MIIWKYSIRTCIKNQIPNIMIINTVQLFSSANPSSRAGKVFQFPFVRIIIACLFLSPVFLLNKVFRSIVTSSAPMDMRIYFAYVEAIIFFFVFLAAYGLYVRFIEKRKAFEISSKLSWKEFGKGFFISICIGRSCCSSPGCHWKLYDRRLES